MCKIDRYRYRSDRCRKFKSHVYTHRDRYYIEVDRLKHQFNCLLDVVHKEEFELYITFLHCHVRLDVLEEALEAFAEVYHAYEYKAQTMDIYWEYYVYDPDPPIPLEDQQGRLGILYNT